MDSSIKKETLKAIFQSALHDIGEIDKEAFEAFYSRTEEKTYAKNEFLIAEGQIEDHLYFIISGAVVVYVKNDNMEYVTNFRFSNQFTCSLNSFLTRVPSKYCNLTLVDSLLLTISYDDLQFLYKEYPQINTLGRIMMERLLIQKRQRELDFMILSAEERYQKMIDEHPNYVLNMT